MSTPALDKIAEELNRRASAHPVGSLQELRGHRPGVALFRLNGKTMATDWACHWGGRKELQFNIGIEGSYLRYGVAFSFGESREYKASELVDVLRPKVARFNNFVTRNPKLLSGMDMWAYEYSKDDHPS